MDTSAILFAAVVASILLVLFLYSVERFVTTLGRGGQAIDIFSWGFVTLATMLLNILIFKNLYETLFS